MSKSSTYQTDSAFRRALKDKIKLKAREAGRPYEQIEREFLLQRFLSRVFHINTDQWVLKGGVGLLVRLPQARFSQDLDLYNRGVDVETAVEDLRRCSTIPNLDRFTFQVGEPRAMTGGTTGVRMKVTCELGGAVFGTIPIDLSTSLETFGLVERITPDPVIEIAEVTDPPPITVYPLPDQVSDKVSAMYSLFNGRPSGRFHDLVDLVLIVKNCDIEAAELLAALRRQSVVRQELCSLPKGMVLPAPIWIQGYAKQAILFGLGSGMRDVESALEYVGRCLNPILGGEITTGTWHAHESRWLPLAE